MGTHVRRMWDHEEKLGEQGHKSMSIWHRDRAGAFTSLPEMPTKQMLLARILLNVADNDSTFCAIRRSHFDRNWPIREIALLNAIDHFANVEFWDKFNFAANKPTSIGMESASISIKVPTERQKPVSSPVLGMAAKVSSPPNLLYAFVISWVILVNADGMPHCTSSTPENPEEAVSTLSALVGSIAFESFVVGSAVAMMAADTMTMAVVRHMRTT